MMLRNSWLIAIAGLLLCGGLAGVAYYFASLPTVLKIAVGPPNSDDMKVVQAIVSQLARERAPVRLRIVQKDGGTRDTAATIDSGEADFAVVRRDIGMPKEGQVVAILRKNVAVFIVPAATAEPDKDKDKAAAKPAGKPTAAAKKTAAAKAKSEKNKAGKEKAEKDKTENDKSEKDKIEKVEDLVGKRVGIVGRSQSNVDLLKAVVRQYGISGDKVTVLSSEAERQPNAPDKISVVQFDPTNVSSALKDAKVQAVLSVGPISSDITANAIAALTHGKEPPTFLDLNASEAIAERNPAYESTEIKAGAFGGAPPRPEESVDTIGVNHYIVARKRLNEDTVAQFTRALFIMRGSLASEVPTAAKIEAPDTDKDASVPVHPGAAAYIDGEMKTFFDRYNDLLYWGLMVLSFLGSGMAGLASYTKSGDRSRRLQVLEKLFEITKSARTATTTQALDQLQERADGVFADMIHDVEANALDEAALSAFSISLEQAQLAISDRRAVLAGNPPPRPPLAAVASL